MTGPGVVTLDGPNGVGKTAVARELARALSWNWLSIGMAYRALAAARAGLDSSLELTWEEASDGGFDPVVRVAGTAFAEEDLLGEELGSAASQLGAAPAWQEKVNQVLRAAAARCGVVVEGRAGQEIFPDPLLPVFLWADPRERAARAAAVTGRPYDPHRERRDRSRAAEPLCIRPGCVVWNSTRFSMKATVAGLARRVRIASGEDVFTVAVTGLHAEHRSAGLRCVPAEGTVEATPDAVLVVPPGGDDPVRVSLAAAHAEPLRYGSDIITVGRVKGSRTDTVLKSISWPANRLLTTPWLLNHGHFAVPADVLALAEDKRGVALGRLSAAPSPERAMPAALDTALQGAWWLPCPVATAPADQGPAARRELAAALRKLQEGDDAAGSMLFDLGAVSEPQAPLWLTAASPDALIDFVYPEPEGRGSS